MLMQVLGASMLNYTVYTGQRPACIIRLLQVLCLPCDPVTLMRSPCRRPSIPLSDAGHGHSLLLPVKCISGCVAPVDIATCATDSLAGNLLPLSLSAQLSASWNKEGEQILVVIRSAVFRSSQHAVGTWFCYSRCSPVPCNDGYQ